jgi:hypothetical protein
MAAAAWGMDNFNEYLHGSRFILYKNPITEPTLETTQVKTLHRLRTTMNNHEFEIKDIQKSDLPDFSKKGQNLTEPVLVSQGLAFNEMVHVDTIITSTNPDKMIVTINHLDGLEPLVQAVRIPQDNLLFTRKSANQQIGEIDQRIGTTGTGSELSKQKGHVQQRKRATMATK